MTLEPAHYDSHHQRLATPWKNCKLCSVHCKSPREFSRHLREFHCSKEGGSYVCRYGPNNICPSLPLEGVSDMDYENHIARDHVQAPGRGRLDTQENYSSVVSPPGAIPSVVHDQHRWTVFDSKVNLPAALNDPLRVKRETDFFTKTWGQEFYENLYVPESRYLPNIDRKYFEKYKHRISKRYRRYAKYKNQIEQEAPGGETFLQQMEKNRAELQQLPKLFLLSNFDLENSDTFNAVFPWTQVEECQRNGGSSQSSKLLQEKLSHYLDIVEVHIAKQISTKSDAFFQAVSSHDVLQDYMLRTCRTIKQLRDKIHSIDDLLTLGSLKIMKLSQTRANYVKLHNKLKLMATVHQTQPTIQLLLSTQEFVGALDLISTTQEVLTQELAGVHSFRHLGSQLAELENIIEKMLQEDFGKCVSADLNRPVGDTEPLLEEEKIVSLVFGMLRKSRFNFVDVYREEAFTAVKAIVKQTVVEAVSEAENVDKDDGNVSSLADQMRMLNYHQWMDLLQQIFSNLLVHLKRTNTFHGVISDVIGIAAGKTLVPSPLPSPTQEDCVLNEASHLHVSVSEEAADVMITEAEYVSVQAKLNEMLCAVCDHSHDRCVKVITARAKDGFLERLSSSEFVALSREVEKFVTDCEVISGRRCMSLRFSLQSQALKFVNRFHEERRTKLSLILDNERWKQADVPAEFQELVNHITHTGMLSLPEKTPDSDKGPGEVLVVEDQTFAVVGTVLMLLKMMVEYCQCVNDIPSAAPDLMSRLVDLFKIFNSRTCQLVLGAGALQLVGLKTISTKNLALASRCLQLVVYFIPKVRQHFEEKLVAKNKSMLKHLDQVQKDYTDHINEITNKLVSVMEGVIAQQLSKDYTDHINEITNKLVSVMEGVIAQQLSKWEVKAPMPSMCFRSICKQISKMHEAVIDILLPDQVKDLFTRINSSFKKLVGQQLNSLEVSKNGGPQHGLVMSDLAFYSGTFKTLRGLESLAKDMSDVWDIR